jgi:8-oxo-dGTP diphosphatase
MRAAIREEVCGIKALDALERDHIHAALRWIDSGAPLCRIAKPADPPQHLVSYFCVVDGEQILLVDHINAQRWLPPGGHVEPGEHPRETVARELLEELGVMLETPLNAPLFLTRTKTVGLSAGHVDVSLWYLVRINKEFPLRYDQSEFKSARWFAFSDIPFDQSDPHLSRFLAKVKQGTHAA